MWKVSFTVFGFVLLGLDKFVLNIEAPLTELGVSPAWIDIAKAFVGQAYDTLAAIALAVLGISVLPSRTPPSPPPASGV